MTVGVGGQLIVGPELHHAAAPENEEDVTVSDRTQSMGNHDRRPSLHSFVQSLLHDLLTVLVQSGRGLVQDQNTWLLDQGASDGNSLLLTPGKLAALGATFLFETFVQVELAILVPLSINGHVGELRVLICYDGHLVVGQLVTHLN